MFVAYRSNTVAVELDMEYSTVFIYLFIHSFNIIYKCIHILYLLNI